MSAVIEALAVDQRVAVKVALFAHLGPGGINAERQYGQREVDDPDAEVFRGRAGEFDRIADFVRGRALARGNRGAGVGIGVSVRAQLRLDAARLVHIPPVENGRFDGNRYALEKASLRLI